MSPTFRTVLLSTFFCVGSIAVNVPSAEAQLTFTLLTPTVTAGRGDTITFSAMLTNTTGTPLFLNNDLGLIDPPLILDDATFQAQFLLPTPQPTLSADGTAHLYSLFTVNLPSNPALYVGFPTFFSGRFTLYGGATDADQDTLGTQEFRINLGPTAPTVPEPGTLALLVGLGAGSVLLTRRRARGARNE